MAYKEVIANAIDISGLTVREISKRCEELGVSVTHSYISQLKTGRANPPSDEVSKVIAEVCGIDPSILILEAYLDKAPKEILDFINNVRHSIIENMIIDIASQIPQNELTDFKRSLYSQPLSQFILEINDEKNRQIDINEAVKMDNIPIDDNSMAPFILKGNIVYYESKKEYKNGEIVVLFYNDNILIRKYYKKEDILIFYPYNLEFEPIITIDEEVKILGKVNKVISYK